MSVNEITIKVNTRNIAGLLAVATMFNELAEQQVIIGNTVSDENTVVAGSATEAFSSVEQQGTPVVDPANAFAQQTPASPVASNVINFPTQQTAEQFAAQHVVPTAPVAPHAITVPVADLDSAGMPYDPRIHAKTKTKCANGTWKKGKGVDPALVAQVEAELRTAMTAPVIPAAIAPLAPVYQPPATPTAPTAPMANLDGPGDGFPAPPVATIPAAVALTAPLAPAPAPPAAVLPLVQSVPVPTTFAELMQVVTAQQIAAKIAFPEIVAICQQHGLENLALIAARPDLIPQVYRDLEATWSGR